MATEIHEWSGNTKRVIGTFDSFAEAKSFAETELGALHMEDDADYDGCADAYLSDGRVIAIQPVNFRADGNSSAYNGV